MALTKEQALEMIRKAQAETFDIESAHGDADDALCGYLESLGHDDLVREWHKVRKWYS